MRLVVTALLAALCAACAAPEREPPVYILQCQAQDGGRLVCIAAPRKEALL